MRQLQTPESMLPDFMEPITPVVVADPAPQPPEQTTEAEPQIPQDDTKTTEATVSDDVAEVTVSETAAAQPAAEDIQVSDPNVTDSDDDTDGLSKQERQLLDAIYKQTVKVSMLGLQERQLSVELDDLRAELNASRDMKTSLLNDLPDALLTLRDGIIAVDTLNAKSSITDTATAAESVIDPNTLSTQTILVEKIKGLGPDKADALVNAFPTLGDLEAARAEAGRSHKHFAEMLPKGLGKIIADELTNRLLNALAGNTQTCAEQVKENQTKPEATLETVTGTTATTDTTTGIPNTDWVTGIVGSLRSSIDDGSCDSQSDTNAWRAGYDAFEENVTVETVISDLGGKPEDTQTEWIRGWLSAELNEKQDVEAQQADEAEEAAAEANSTAIEETSSVGTTEVYEDVPDDDAQPTDLKAKLEQVINIADRQVFAEHVRSKDDLRFKHDKESWQAGYEASIDEQPLEACPASLSHDQESDWIRGWVDGSSVGADL